MNIKRSILLCAIFSLALASTAQEKGYWTATSTTARSITGDVSISASKLYINFTPFTIAQIGAMQPAEVDAVFSDGTTGPGNLYAISVPGTKAFLHKNTLCGTEDAHWMITYVSGKTLQLAFFSGTRLPVFTSEAIAGGTSLCGTFTYTR